MEPGHPRPDFLTLASAPIYVNTATVQNKKVVAATFLYLADESIKSCAGLAGNLCFGMISKGLAQGEISSVPATLTESQSSSYVTAKKPLSLDSVGLRDQLLKRSFALSLWTPFQFGWNNTEFTARSNEAMGPLQDTEGVLKQVEKLLLASGQSLDSKESSQVYLSLKISDDNQLRSDLVLLWWNRGGSTKYSVTANVYRLSQNSKPSK